MLKSLTYATFGLLMVTACLSAQESKESFQVQTIYTKGLQSIEKDPHIARMLAHSGTDLSIGQSKNERYEYAEVSVIDRLKDLQLDISYHDAVGHYVEFYINSDPDRLKLLFGLNQYYNSSVSSSLENNGLPQGFALIPAVCSSFGPTSTNGHGGTGPWHLNYPQAIRYGLQIDKNVDERREMEKATVAATAYLSDLYKLYDNWELTLAAYTCGPATINKALSRQEASTFWEIYKVLPEEMRDIVPALAALVYVQGRQNTATAFEVHIDTDTVRIHKRLLHEALNDVVNADLEELNFLNPALNAKAFPANYTAVFPAELKERFFNMKDSVYAYQDSVLLYPKPKTPEEVPPVDGIAITHIVKSGEVLGLIAEKYEVGVSQIQQWNDMGGSTRLNIGQKLVIYSKSPLSKTVPTEESSETAKALDKEYVTYTVKKGECLDGIAKKYPGISARNIMELNNIDDNIQAELILRIKKR